MSFVPPPRFVQLAVVFNDKLTRTDSFAVEAACSLTLGVDAKGLFVRRSDDSLIQPLGVEPMESFEHLVWILWREFITPSQILAVRRLGSAILNDELASLAHVIALSSKEVHCSQQAFIDEAVLGYDVVH